MDPKLWTDPKVLALARKVKSYADPNAKKDQNYNTTMEVKLTNGKSYKAFEPYPPGSPLNMVSRDVLRAKFRKMARAVLTEERIDKLIEAVDRLETCERCGPIDTAAREVTRKKTGRHHAPPHQS